MASPQALSSQMASLQAQSDSDKLSDFEKLPAELRVEVYKHVLKAENVRQPPDDDLVCHYRFEVRSFAPSLA